MLRQGVMGLPISSLVLTSEIAEIDSFVDFFVEFFQGFFDFFVEFFQGFLL